MTKDAIVVSLYLATYRFSRDRGQYIGNSGGVLYPWDLEGDLVSFYTKEARHSHEHLESKICKMQSGTIIQLK